MKWCMSLLAVLLAAAALQAQTVPEAEKKDGFLSMFNGKDFTGWRFGNGSALPDKLPDVAKVEDGVIKITGKPPHLGTQWDYEDFDVRFEWRAMQDKYNSGFYIRSGRSVGANQINLAKGGEGGWVPGGGGVKLPGAKTVPDLQNKPMEWNAWRVLAVGDKVTFWCNDKLAWEATGFEANARLHRFAARRGEDRVSQPPHQGDRLCVLNDAKKWKFDDSGWKIDDGTFTQDGKRLPLETAKMDYKDYVFRVEYKAEKNASGGIGLRGEKCGRTGFRVAWRLGIRLRRFERQEASEETRLSSGTVELLGGTRPGQQGNGVAQRHGGRGERESQGRAGDRRHRTPAVG